MYHPHSMNRQLISITKSWPLRHLKPGGTLVIQSPSSPLHLSLQVRIVPEKTREDGHVTLHQKIRPRVLLSKNSNFSDISSSNKEVDMEISTLTYSFSPKNSHIQVLVDFKKNFDMLKQQQVQNSNQSILPLVPRHRPVSSIVSSYHYSDVQDDDMDVTSETNTVSASSFSSNNTANKSVQSRFRYITDDGRLLVSLPTETSSSSSSSNTSETLTTTTTTTTLEPTPSIHDTFEQVEYNDGITHLKDIHTVKKTSIIASSNQEEESAFHDDTHTDMWINNNNHNNNNYKDKNLEPSETQIYLTAIIPEKCNVKCFLCPQPSQSTTSSHHTFATCNNSDSIVMEPGSKLEGEDGFEFVTMGGDITISKLRGKVIHVSTNGTFQQENNNNNNSSTSHRTTTTKENKNSTGSIHVSKALEAQELHVTLADTGRFRAKLIHASKATIRIPNSHHTVYDSTKLDLEDGLAPIDISSIYTTQGAFLSIGSFSSSSSLLSQQHDMIPFKQYNPRKVRINSSHGHVSIKIKDSIVSKDFFLKELSKPFLDDQGRHIAMVDLGSVNGSFDIHLHQHHHHTCSEQRWILSNHCNLLAARIHIDSLLNDHISIFNSNYVGLTTELTLDRKLESDVRFLSTPWVDLLDIQQVIHSDASDISTYLSKLNMSFHPAKHLLETTPILESRPWIDIRTKSFQGHLEKLSNIHYAWGCLENISLEPDSRYDHKQSKDIDFSRGKVSRNDATQQALNSFSSREKHNDDRLSYPPLMVFINNGFINVETLDWAQAISRRFGLSLGRSTVKQTTSTRQ